MHNLTISYYHVGRKDEALKLREEVLALRRKVLGPEHSDTLWAMTNLADSYGAAGRKDEAFKLREQVLMLTEKMSNVHQDNAMLQNGLAWDIVTSEEIEPRDLNVAEKLATRANEASEDKDANCLDTLALVLFMQGKKEAAIKRQEQAVSMVEDKRKPEFQKTLDSYRQGILPKP